MAGMGLQHTLCFVGLCRCLTCWESTVRQCVLLLDTYLFCTAGSDEEGIQELIAAARQELDGLHMDYEGTVQRKLDIARRLFQLKGAASMQV